MAQNAPQLNVEGDHQFVPRSKLRRDIRPLHMQMWDVFTQPAGLFFGNIFFCLSGFIFPGTLLLSTFFVSFIWLISVFSKKIWQAQMPLRLPLDEAKNYRVDYGDPKPSHRGYNTARGTFFLGNAWKNIEEVWAAFTDMLTHCLVIGGTGAGKSELLMSMLFNGLALTGGGLYVDPKGGPKLVGQYWNMCRFCGRDDDVRILNFALGQEELSKTPFVRSNTLQPFAFGKAEALKELPLSLMPGGDDKSGNSIFSSNGKTLVSTLTMGLVDLRNKGEIYFTVNDLRKYMASDKYIELATRKDLSPVTQEAMKSFLTSMGWKEGVADRTKWGDFDRQYSYAQNYFLDALSTMSDTYRHIFNVPIGDINMVDIILQRRMFLCIIPSLEKSKKELSSLGRITLAVIRLAVSVGLGGGEIMGNWKELVDLNVAASEVPSFLFVDEYAAIAVDGFAEVFTQGRSLGMSGTIGSQDWAGIKKANEAEAQQIVANTKLKFIMTTDDPNDTKNLIKSLADDDEEIRSQGFAVNGLINYYDNLSAQAVKASRIDFKDLSGQVEGEWHLFFKNRIIRGAAFYAGGLPNDDDTPIFVHHMLMVERPNYTTLSAQFGVIKETMDRWIAQTKQAPSEQNVYADGDYAGMEGCMPLGEVFRVSRISEAFQRDCLGQSKSMFSMENRRELACAAVYSWLEEKTEATDMGKAYRDALNGGRTSSSAATQGAQGQASSESAEPQQSVRDEASTGTEKTVSTADAQPDISSEVGPNATSESAPKASEGSDVGPDDILSGLESRLHDSPSESPKVAEGSVGATEEKQEKPVSDSDAAVATRKENFSFERERTSVADSSSTGSSDAPGDRMETARSAFSGLVDFVEQTVGAQEQTTKKIAEATSEESDPVQRQQDAEAVVTATKQHVLQVLTDPQYPSPPTPDPMEPSKFRSLAERWIRQVKEN